MYPFISTFRMEKCTRGQENLQLHTNHHTHVVDFHFIGVDSHLCIRYNDRTSYIV